MFQRYNLCAIVIVLVLLAITSSVHAALSVSHYDDLGLTQTNFMGDLSVPKFDPSLGALQEVELTFWGHVEGEAQFESRNATPADVTMDLSVKINIKGPDQAVLVAILPLVHLSDHADAYDGHLDFAGTSGRSYDNLSADALTSAIIYTQPSDLQKFIGIGDVNLPVSGIGMSSGHGPGNIVFHFHTLADASVLVNYRYSVPEPATASLIALAALFGRRYRRAG